MNKIAKIETTPVGLAIVLAVETDGKLTELPVKTICSADCMVLQEAAKRQVALAKKAAKVFGEEATFTPVENFFEMPSRKKKTEKEVTANDDPSAVGEKKEGDDFFGKL